MKTITIKNNAKMKTIKLNKNGKARQPKKTKFEKNADQITNILAHVSDMCEYAKRNLCNEECQFEELEEMLWKLVR